MRLAAIVVVASVGVVVTALAAARGWRASRRGDAPELVAGYLAVMVAVSALSFLALRVL